MTLTIPWSIIYNVMTFVGAAIPVVAFVVLFNEGHTAVGLIIGLALAAEYMIGSVAMNAFIEKDKKHEQAS